MGSKPSLRFVNAKIIPNIVFYTSTSGSWLRRA
nr:MAG TPA: hypothetical protein [Bacteriophage sp.]